MTTKEAAEILNKSKHRARLWKEYAGDLVGCAPPGTETLYLTAFEGIAIAEAYEKKELLGIFANEPDWDLHGLSQRIVNLQIYQGGHHGRLTELEKRVKELEEHKALMERHIHFTV
jgi:hypothetical protein